ncbi:MAG: hypothetical protein M1821_005111 [Bathelium mastoideum]|nr:MAG: hypothetical protein M1821_005111 [Bathelium mastoideum]
MASFVNTYEPTLHFVTERLGVGPMDVVDSASFSGDYTRDTPLSETGVNDPEINDLAYSDESNPGNGPALFSAYLLHPCEVAEQFPGSHGNMNEPNVIWSSECIVDTVNAAALEELSSLNVRCRLSGLSGLRNEQSADLALSISDFQDDNSIMIRHQPRVWTSPNASQSVSVSLPINELRDNKFVVTHPQPTGRISPDTCQNASVSLPINTFTDNELNLIRPQPTGWALPNASEELNPPHARSTFSNRGNKRQSADPALSIDTFTDNGPNLIRPQSIGWTLPNASEEFSPLNMRCRLSCRGNEGQSADPALFINTFTDNGPNLICSQPTEWTLPNVLEELNPLNMGCRLSGCESEHQSASPALFVNTFTENELNLSCPQPTGWTLPNAPQSFGVPEIGASSGLETMIQQPKDDRFRCGWLGCNVMFGRSYDRDRHFQSKHVSQTQIWCSVSGCKRSAASGGKPFTRRDKLYEHIRRMHERAT